MWTLCSSSLYLRYLYRIVFQRNQWLKKSLHLQFGLTTPTVNTGCSQKRLTEGESAIQLWDTDAYGTWSAGPGGDYGRGSVLEGAPEGQVRAEQLAGKVSWPELSQHVLCQKTIKENIFRLTTSRIKKPHNAVILKSELCERAVHESQRSPPPACF